MTVRDRSVPQDTVVVPLHGLPRDDEAVCELRRPTDERLALPVYDTVAGHHGGPGSACSGCWPCPWRSPVSSSPGVLTYWWLWALYAVVGIRSTSRQYLAAGADWLQAGRTDWVGVYALRTVTVAAGTGQHWITLAHSGERHATISTNELHANPALWDLVYNGIRHSAADGALITGSGAHNLRPPGPDDR